MAPLRLYLTVGRWKGDDAMIDRSWSRVFNRSQFFLVGVRNACHSCRDGPGEGWQDGSGGVKQVRGCRSADQSRVPLGFPCYGIYLAAERVA